MNALVLLSGGLDSTAALLLAHQRWSSAEAVVFDYGQPAYARELAAARNAAEHLGIILHERDLSAAFAGLRTGLLAGAPPAGVDGSGRDTAFVPCRNLILLSVAASVALQRWPDSGIDLIVGFNVGDAAGFPDCREGFCRALSDAINLGNGRACLRVFAPWIGRSKRQVVEWVQEQLPSQIDVLRDSWSCYAAQGPCGECTGCVTRAAALEGEG